MKAKIHPEYHDSTITCSCGNVIQTRSTKPEIKVEICSNCHPFFTGKQKFVDTAGRVEKFQRRYGWTQDRAQQQAQKGKKGAPADSPAEPAASPTEPAASPAEPAASPAGSAAQAAAPDEPKATPA